MTSRAKKQGNEARAPEASTSAPLPFDPATLAQGVRVSQADFARLAGVSRQTVSQWVRKGKIQTVYPDGSLDPARAARDVIRNTKPSQLRAKVFKVATEDAQALRIRLADLERKYAAAIAFGENLLQALRDTGVSEGRVEYLEWLASTGRRHTDADEDDEDNAAQAAAPGPEGLPLFETASPRDETDTPPGH